MARPCWVPGRTEQGLALLEQAAQAEPTNAKYRIAVTNGKMRALNSLNGRAEAPAPARQPGQAQTLYRQALAIDASDDVAQRARPAWREMSGTASWCRKRRPATSAAAKRMWRRRREALRQVLQERPAQREALAKSRIGDEQAQARPAGGKLAAAYRKPVTLEFRDAPLRSVFDFISKVSGLNFVFDKEIDPALRATISVRHQHRGSYRHAAGGEPAG